MNTLPGRIAEELQDGLVDYLKLDQVEEVDNLKDQGISDKE